MRCDTIHIQSFIGEFQPQAAECSNKLKTLFGNKIKEVAKGNFEAQQQRFLATSSVATTMQQQQKVTYLAPPAFKRPKQPAKPSRPQRSQSFRPKSQTKSHSSNRKEYAKRIGNQKQFPSSKQASSSTKF